MVDLHMSCCLPQDFADFVVNRAKFNGPQRVIRTAFPNANQDSYVIADTDNHVSAADTAL